MYNFSKYDNYKKKKFNLNFTKNKNFQYLTSNYIYIYIYDHYYKKDNPFYSLVTINRQSNHLYKKE